MSESKLEQGTRPFPLWGYVLINAVVWVVCLLTYLALINGWFSTVSARVQRPAFGGVLLIVALAFLGASIYDYGFDRVRRRFERSTSPEDADDAVSRKDRSDSAE